MCFFYNSLIVAVHRNSLAVAARMNEEYKLGIEQSNLCVVFVVITENRDRVTVGTKDLWPYLIALQAIPAVTSLAATPFLPETPRYLMIMKNDEAAAQKCT